MKYWFSAETRKAVWAGFLAAAFFVQSRFPADPAALNAFEWLLLIAEMGSHVAAAYGVVWAIPNEAPKATKGKPDVRFQ